MVPSLPRTFLDVCDAKENSMAVLRTYDENGDGGATVIFNFAQQTSHGDEGNDVPRWPRGEFKARVR